jgi:hypothetical protein
MKIKTVNYTYGGMSLELIAETDIEYMVLKQIFTHGGMTMGNGNTKTPDGMATGFYLNTSSKREGEERSDG